MFQKDHAEMPEYDITYTHFRDMAGRLLWIEPLDQEYRLYRPGETDKRHAGVVYRIERVAIVDNTQHVNVSVVEEDIIITEPHL